MTVAADSVGTELRPVAGRECGSCSLCCKVYHIAELDKAAGRWCGQCKPGRGCKIYAERPPQCVQFECLWRTDAAMPVQWKPDQAKMVATIHPLSRNIHVQVDPGLPSAWSRQPYHDHLRQWSRQNLPKGICVVVFVNELATLVLPDQDIALGPVTPDQSVSVRQESGPNGPVYEIKIAALRTMPDGQTIEVATTSRHPIRTAA